MTPQISVVIPAYCTRERHGTSRLRLTLAGFANQTLDRESFEVVLVDDGSDWDLQREFEPDRRPSRLRVLRREHDGMCAAYNHGCAAAEGELILLAIDDNVPCPELLEHHLAAHVRAGDDATVICGRERFLLFASAFRDPIRGELDPAAVRERPGLLHALDLVGGRHRRITEEDVQQRFDELARVSSMLPAYADIERTVTAGGFGALRAGWLAMRVGNHSLARDLLDRAGGLDERFDPSGFYADNELGMRLREAGARLEYDVDALMLHVSHAREPGFMDAALSGHARFLERFPRMDVALLPHFFSLGLTIEEYSRRIEALPLLAGTAVEAAQT